MKKFFATAVVAVAFTSTAMAAQFKGVVEDQNCSKMPAMQGNADCAKKCIKGGTPAVLVTPDGHVYKIANQDKIVAHAGENVVVDGELAGDTITVKGVS
jgi:hypothetical protein